MNLLIIGVVAICVVALFSKPFAKLLGVGKENLEAQVNKAANNLANADPIAVYKLKIDQAVSNLRSSQEILEKSASQIQSLTNQIDKNQKDKARLEQRLAATMAANDVNGTAENYAKQLISVEEDLKNNADQLENARKIYNENLAMLERHQRVIDEAKQDARNLESKLKQSEVDKQIIQMTAAMKDSLSTDGLAESRRLIQEKIDNNAGAIQAARDLSATVFAEEKDDDLVKDAKVSAVLERFKPKKIETETVNS